MAGVCDPNGCEDMFGAGFARKVARKYRRRGLDATATRMVDFLAADGLEGATVLEIGGGVGEIGLELVRRGAASATCLELSTAYDEEAARLAREAGVAHRVRRRVVDIARAPHEVAAADLVVLHRVVCCYPDHRRLLRAAADHCRGRLAFSHPPRNLVSRAVVAIQNTLFILTGRSFKAYVHPPDAMVAVVTARGLRPVLSQSGRVWQVQGLAR